MDNKVVLVIAAVLAIAVIGVPLLVKLSQSGDRTAAAGGQTSSDSSGATALATGLVASLTKGDMAAVTATFDGAMKAALTADKLKEVWNGVMAQVGAFKSQVGTRSEKKQGFDVVYVTCEFERGKLDFQVAVNGANQVSGLYVVPPGR
jgi:preprotein translocase subunit SecG